VGDLCWRLFGAFNSKMVGDSLGLVLVIPMNKDARRVGEMDQIAFEIDLFRSGQKAFDMLHQILPSFLEMKGRARSLWSRRLRFVSIAITRRKDWIFLPGKSLVTKFSYHKRKCKP